jgi:hydrogenase maturation factor HypF (carbamoyltransferase family)
VVPASALSKIFLTTGNKPLWRASPCAANVQQNLTISLTGGFMRSQSAAMTAGQNTLCFFRRHPEVCNNIAEETAKRIDGGHIIAVKGTGGFHLACNAFDHETVNRLRHRKLREGKPFAVMFPSVEILEEYAHIDEHEKKELCSWKRPVVLLKSKNKLPATVSAGLDTLGVMLPYMPFHHQLFKHLKTKAIILTSAKLV